MGSNPKQLWKDTKRLDQTLLPGLTLLKEASVSKHVCHRSDNYQRPIRLSHDSSPRSIELRSRPGDLQDIQRQSVEGLEHTAKNPRQPSIQGSGSKILQGKSPQAHRRTQGRKHSQRIGRVHWRLYNNATRTFPTIYEVQAETFSKRLELRVGYSGQNTLQVVQRTIHKPGRRKSSADQGTGQKD